MKKTPLVFIIFLLMISPSLYSLDSNPYALEEKGIGLFVDANIRVLWPEEYSPDLLPERAMGFINFGTGFFYTFIPNILSPGIFLM